MRRREQQTRERFYLALQEKQEKEKRMHSKMENAVQKKETELQ